MRLRDLWSCARMKCGRGQKSIEEVKAGEWVVSRDERTGEVSYQRVKRTFERVSEAIVTVKAGNETIQTTPEHPFWVAGKGWVAAKELGKGERLVTADEKVVVVTEVRVEAVRGPPVVVYNFEVENTHTYFVGREGVWVHNACGPLNPGDDLSAIMGNSGLTPTQSSVSASKINRFASDMAGGRWDWSTPNLTNPLMMDAAGNIMSGHHRFIAAQLAGVEIPESAITVYPGITLRPPIPWGNVIVKK